jgi:hypothetical protein
MIASRPLGTPLLQFVLAMLLTSNAEAANRRAGGRVRARPNIIRRQPAVRSTAPPDHGNRAVVRTRHDDGIRHHSRAGNALEQRLSLNG